MMEAWEFGREGEGKGKRERGGTQDYIGNPLLFSEVAPSPPRLVLTI